MIDGMNVEAMPDRAEGEGEMKKSIAIGFVVAGAMNWFLPGFNGMFFEPSAISVGESRIIAALFLIGGAILWYLPRNDPDVGTLSPRKKRERKS
jgi:hypothetical protein